MNPNNEYQTLALAKHASKATIANKLAHIRMFKFLFSSNGITLALSFALPVLNPSSTSAANNLSGQSLTAATNGISGESSTVATDDVSEQSVTASSWQLFKQPGAFILSLASQGQSNVWIGTEGNGVFRYEPGATNKQWTQFTATNGLGDNFAYALACDQQGRIWVGHLNHGVSIFNGSEWRNYDVIDGPIGERVFRIVVCPTDGDVWMATSAGLTRYSVREDSWKYYTRANGLPSDQANALCFDEKGNLYVGTQCDGIAIASDATDYRKWRVVPGPNEVPASSRGSGLPSAQINDLVACREGMVYAATSAGLAYSTNQGGSWNYVRGEDYAAKLKGLAAAPGTQSDEAAKSGLPKILPADYVTSLAEDATGLLWVGFRRHGFVALSTKTHRAIVKDSRHLDAISAISPTGSKIFWGSYKGGFWASVAPSHRRSRMKASTHSRHHEKTKSIPFPTLAQAPSVSELNQMLQEVTTAENDTNSEAVSVLTMEDDWRTQGQWLGRYGRFWVALCANWAPNDNLWGAGWDVTYKAEITRALKPGDQLRYWVHWLATKENRCLEMSPTYFDSRLVKHLTTRDADRRQAEWDDGGESHPMTEDGPDVQCKLHVPAGLFYLSLYDNNKDGHASAHGRFRDYHVLIKPSGAKPEEEPLAQGRIENFWPGVYKRFLVRGPADLCVQIKRNYSFNTILAGVMLDLVDELPPPYYLSRQQWEQKQRDNQKENDKAEATPAQLANESAAGKATRLLAALQTTSTKNEVWWAVNKRRLYLALLRWFLQHDPKPGSDVDLARSLASCYYQVGLYPRWENGLDYSGITSTREIEKSLRWDGKTYSTSGKEYEILSAYLKAHPPERKNQSAAQSRN